MTAAFLAIIGSVVAIIVAVLLNLWVGLSLAAIVGILCAETDNS